MKACQTYEGMSNLYWYVTLILVCQTYEGTSRTLKNSEFTLFSFNFIGTKMCKTFAPKKCYKESRVAFRPALHLKTRAHFPDTYWRAQTIKKATMFLISFHITEQFMQLSQTPKKQGCASLHLTNQPDLFSWSLTACLQYFLCILGYSTPTKVF